MRTTAESPGLHHVEVRKVGNRSWKRVGRMSVHDPKNVSLLRFSNRLQAGYAYEVRLLPAMTKRMREKREKARVQMRRLLWLKEQGKKGAARARAGRR